MANAEDKLVDHLKILFADNFSAYVKAHGFHVAVVGHKFYEYHKMYQKIYEFLQDNIDTLGEEIQACGVGRVPETIGMIMDTSDISDAMPDMTADGLLTSILDDLYTLIDTYHDMYDAGEAANYPDVSNMAADHIGRIAAFCWKLEATLDIPGRHPRRT